MARAIDEIQRDIADTVASLAGLTREMELALKATQTPENVRILLDQRRLCKKLDIGTSTLFRWRRSGEFPKPVSVRGALRWYDDEIDEWLQKDRPRY